MGAPAGKGLFIRGSTLYPDDDPVGYAAQLDCAFVALLERDTPQDYVYKAHDLGLGAYFWSGPEDWTPDTFRQTLYTQAERADRLGMAGFIADAEHSWERSEDAAHQLAADLTSAQALLPSVGFTSYPTWRYTDVVASSGVWGAPQVYGVQTPGTPAQLRARFDTWAQMFTEALPVLGIHSPTWRPSERYYRDTEQEQRAYQGAFSDVAAAMIWQHTGPSGLIWPTPGTATFELWQQWQPRGAPSPALVADWRPRPVAVREPTPRTLAATTVVSALRRARGRLV